MWRRKLLVLSWLLCVFRSARDSWDPHSQLGVVTLENLKRTADLSVPNTYSTCELYISKLRIVHVCKLPGFPSCLCILGKTSTSIEIWIVNKNRAVNSSTLMLNVKQQTTNMKLAFVTAYIIFLKRLCYRTRFCAIHSIGHFPATWLTPKIRKPRNVLWSSWFDQISQVHFKRTLPRRLLHCMFFQIELACLAM